MKLPVRLGKFTLVGTAGTALQLGALALLDRLAPGHYLWTSAAAVEIALLHNFAWHCRYTWRDRKGAEPRMRSLLRFHLTAGAVSLVGNLVLMRLFVGNAHLPALAANYVAILCCSLVNFCAADHWVFAEMKGNAGDCDQDFVVTTNKSSRFHV